MTVPFSDWLDSFNKSMLPPKTVRMGRVECVAHRHRELVPIEQHHVWPLGRGGPDVPANIVMVCENAHGSIHSLLDLLLKSSGSVPWTTRRRYGRKVRELAVKGFEAIRSGKVPG
jgi:hypothetical protein